MTASGLHLEVFKDAGGHLQASMDVFSLRFRYTKTQDKTQDIRDVNTNTVSRSQLPTITSQAVNHGIYATW